MGRTGAGGCSKNVWGKCLVSKNVWGTCAACVQLMSTCAVLMHAVISFSYICRYVSRESSGEIRFLWGSCSVFHGSSPACPHPARAVGWCRQHWAACLQARRAHCAAQGVVCMQTCNRAAASPPAQTSKVLTARPSANSTGPHRLPAGSTDPLGQPKRGRGGDRCWGGLG